MAAFTFLVLSHKLAHARGERVSAGPGIEYMVGTDGLLYQCSTIKVPGKGTRYQQAPLPGVHPDHAAALLISPNIREVKDYAGPVYSVKAASTPVIPAGGTVDKAAYDALQAQFAVVTAERDALSTLVDQLRAENDGLRGSVRVERVSVPAEVPENAAQPPPAPPVSAPPAASVPPVPAATPGDNQAPDTAGILGLSVGKLGAELAAGKHDAILADLRSAEVAGKNRTGALAVIDARIEALKS